MHLNAATSLGICYVDANSSECLAVVQGRKDGNWRADQPGTMQFINFETFTFPKGTIDTCYLDTYLGQPCALTIGAGVQWHEAHAAANASARTLGGGTSAGGSGSIMCSSSPWSLLTPTGAYITANARQHIDLFWALRGGGGGTYGWGGYTLIAPSNGTLNYTRFCIIPNVSWARARETIIPYLNYVQDLAANTSRQDPVDTTIALTAPFSSFYDWYTTIFNTSGEVGVNTEAGSWFLSRSALENDHENVASTLVDIVDFDY
ncbi:hypothetical protein BV20DRAFT_979518 [Pilatotrama ljubarskyi]|nr:hypothetical protein BV20DRAFT_979518 [Pilatotrama ljubarskyi]